jgi:hypothetical protein
MALQPLEQFILFVSVRGLFPWVKYFLTEKSLKALLKDLTDNSDSLTWEQEDFLFMLTNQFESIVTVGVKETLSTPHRRVALEAVLTLAQMQFDTLFSQKD